MVEGTPLPAKHLLVMTWLGKHALEIELSLLLAISRELRICWMQIGVKTGSGLVRESSP